MPTLQGFPARPKCRLENEVVSFNKADADPVVSHSRLDQLYHLLQQLIYGQDRVETAPDLINEADLLCLLLLLLEEASVLDGHGGLVGQGLKHNHVIIIEGIQTPTLNIKDADDLIFGSQGDELRSGLGDLRHEIVIWLLGDVGCQQGLASAGYLADNSFLAYFEAQWLAAGFPVRAGSRLHNHFISLGQADANQVVSQNLTYLTYDLFKQLVNIQYGDDLTADLANHTKLLCSSLLGLEEPCVLDSYANLVPDGGQ
jgi:hypothetical protein